MTKMNKTGKPENNKESGNAMVFVLVALVLFVTLVMTFTKDSQQGTSALTKQQAKIYASEILEYAKKVDNAVNRVRAKNGCSENELNFDNSEVTGYTNTDAPTDDSCDIFDDDGGKISYKTPETSWLDTSQSAQTSYQEWVFTGDNYVPDVGTNTSESGNELALIIMYLNQQTCIEINNYLDVSNSGGLPPAEGNNISLTKFQGSFGSSPAVIYDANPGDDPSACLTASDTTPASGTYFFYHSLLIR
jgi:hypothetical protein